MSEPTPRARAGGLDENTDGDVIVVEVHLFPPLRTNRFDRTSVSLAAASTVHSLLEQLDIREQEVESVYVNGRGATYARKLAPGDRVTLLPTIGGG